MPKLMKYEFRKQLFSKLAIMAIMLCLELYFFYGVIFEKESTAAKGVLLLTVFAFISILFVTFECIITFNNDLKTKQSYMLFLVPKSTYSVVGAKVLASIIQIALTGLFFGIVAFADIFAVFARFGEIESFAKGLQQMLREMFAINIDTERIIITLVSIIVSWIFIVVLAMLSITLSTTLLANSKVRGIVSFLLFMVAASGIMKLEGLISGNINFANSNFIVSNIYYIIVSVLLYLATAWMLDKKVSV